MMRFVRIAGGHSPPYRLLLRAALVVLCMAGSALANEQPRWPDEMHVGRFHVRSDAALAPHRDLLNELPRLEQEIAAQLGVQLVEQPIHVYLFSQRASYQQYLTQYFPQAPTRKALFIKSRGANMVFAYNSRELAVDLRHECTHAILHGSLPMVPLWLDEGLAEYFEAPAEERAKANAHQSGIKWNARLGIVPDMDELEKLNDLAAMGRTEYRDSWAWVHFMLHGPPAAREELHAFLRDIAAHAPPGALSARLRHRVADVRGEYLKHFRGWK